MMHLGICEDYCPTGYKPAGDSRSCINDTSPGPNSLILHYKSFIEFSNTYADIVSSHPMYLGATDDYYQTTTDQYDPMTHYYAGLHFIGKSYA
jgi:hypothetical protein